MTTKEQIQKLSRGTTEIIDIKTLEHKIAKSARTKKKLCIKAGFDPTAPDIHLGHVVLLRKLRQFQDLGHQVYFLIGDFNAMVGDPTGRTQTRPKLSRQEIKKNAQTYEKQVYKVLDKKKTRVVFNSEWLGELSSQNMLELSSYTTVAQMLARADFKKRFEAQREISILEFIYPLLQGYDSVHMKADVELGGTDQKFNLLMGRQLQEAYGQEPQVVLMTPLLEGTDGVQKMSKSLGNYIGINESPKEIFGKIMSISDELMLRYAELLTDFDLLALKAMHPKEAKVKLAEEVVSQFHGLKKAQEAKIDFERTFSQRQSPEDMASYTITPGQGLVQALVDSGLAGSNNEARRLIQQGAVSLEGAPLQEKAILTPGVLKVGKRRFLRLVL